jgi:hypothetical protein
LKHNLHGRSKRQQQQQRIRKGLRQITLCMSQAACVLAHHWLEA